METITAMAHTDVGVGEPAALFLPGWCGGREVFDPLVACTARHRRSVSVDWRGHGGSPSSSGDFDADDLLRDALALVDQLGLQRVVPVGLSHAGWLALELRRALGPTRVPGVVLMDWMPLGPPPGFLEALTGLQDAQQWSAVREQLFAMWGAGVDAPAVHAYIASMAEYGADMWRRAGREIARSFATHEAPLAAVAALAAEQGRPCPTLHLYAQPRDEGYLAAQQDFAAGHDWFRVRRLDASSHFPCLEVPGEIAEALDDFIAELP